MRETEAQGDKNELQKLQGARAGSRTQISDSGAQGAGFCLLYNTALRKTILDSINTALVRGTLVITGVNVKSADP